MRCCFHFCFIQQRHSGLVASGNTGVAHVRGPCRHFLLACLPACLSAVSARPPVSSSAEPSVERTTPLTTAGPSTAGTVLTGKRRREEPTVGGETADDDSGLGSEKTTTPPDEASANKRTKAAGDVSPLNVSQTPVVDGTAGREVAEAVGAVVVGKPAAAKDPVLSAGMEAASLFARHGRQQKSMVAGADGSAVGEQRANTPAVGDTPTADGQRQEAGSTMAAPETDVVARQQAVMERQVAAAEASTVAARQKQAWAALAERNAAVFAAAGVGKQDAVSERLTQRPPPPLTQHCSPRFAASAQAISTTGAVAFQQTPPLPTGAGGARLPAASVAISNAIANAAAQSYSSTTPFRPVSPRSVAAMPMTRDCSRPGGQGGQAAHQTWTRPSIADATAAAARAHGHAWSVAHGHTQAAYGNAQARVVTPGGWAFPPGSNGAGRLAGTMAGFQRVPQMAWGSGSVPAANTAHLRAPAPPPPQQAAATAPGNASVSGEDGYQAQIREALAQSMWRGYWTDGATSPPADQPAGRVAVAAGDAGRVGGTTLQRQQSAAAAGRAVPGVVSSLPAPALRHSPSPRDAGPSHPGVTARWPPSEPAPTAAASAPSSPRPAATSPGPTLLGKRKNAPSSDATVLSQRTSTATFSPRGDRPVPVAEHAPTPTARPEGVSGGGGGPPLVEGHTAPFGLTVPPPPPQLGSAASGPAPAAPQSQLPNAGPAQGGAGAESQAGQGEMEKQREQEMARVARREKLRRSMMSAEHLHILFRSLGGPEAGNRGNDERSRLYLLGECF